jgi:hypothetical protein
MGGSLSQAWMHTGSGCRTHQEVQNMQEPLNAVIQGADDAWEVCLLKFTIDMIERSSGGNVGDFRNRGLL